MGALSGLVVCDVSRILAGPYCGQLFADQGAEVIKIEPVEGDPNRIWPIRVDELSTSYLSVNRNKKSVTVNLATEKGRAIFYGLIAKTDVLIHNYLPATAAKLGVSDEELERVNPDLVRVAISGYGSKGPMRNKPGYDTMVTAFSGIMSLTGEKDGPSVKPGVSAIDLGAGMLAYAGAVTALLARGKNGVRGQRVDVSLLETAISFLGVHALNWLVAGQVDQRQGADFGPIVPYGRYRCQDGDIMVGVSDQRSWFKLCDVLGSGGLAANPLYATPDLRVQHEAALRVDLEGVLTTRTVTEWCAVLDAGNVSNSPIQTIDQVFADPQVRANDMVVETRMADGRTIPLLGLPIKMSGTPGEIGNPPPLLGEHNAEIFGRYLNLSSTDLNELKARGVV